VDIKSVVECSQHCIDTEGCNMWKLTKNVPPFKGHTCELTSDKSPNESHSGLEDLEGATIGYWAASCDKCTDVANNHYFPLSGKDLKYASASCKKGTEGGCSWEKLLQSCEEKCFGEKRCKAFSLVQRQSGNIYCYGADSKKYKVVLPEAVSGKGNNQKVHSRTCPGPGTASQNLRYSATKTEI